MSTVFCIFDGFGLLPTSKNNCIALADMPNFRSLLKNNFWSTLNADGVMVGQEEGLVGNSEVGHMNLGGLQLVAQLSYQITKSSEKNFIIDKSIAKDQIFDPKSKLQNKEVVHLIGLFSSGSIHSDLRHWTGAIKSSLSANVKKIYLHLITDGRDSDRASFIETLNDYLSSFSSEELSKVYLGSFGGRAYAMDRDNNFDKVYYGMQGIFGPKLIDKTVELREKFKIENYQKAEFVSKEVSILKAIDSIEEKVKEQYSNKVFDEFLEPTSYTSIGESDALWLINFRADRMRQIVKMLTKFNDNSKHLILAMNDYGIEHDGYEFIFKTQPVEKNFAYFASKVGKTQLHTSETEKYNHVTYFFNGGHDKKQSNEDWLLVPSNKLQNHSEKPEMKAEEITQNIIDNLDKYDYIIVNYANPDMVGHCGDIEAGIKSMELLDIQLGKLLNIIEKGNHNLVLTADHGNMEFVGAYTDNGKLLTDTEHNPSPVPLIIVKKDFDSKKIIDSISKFALENNINYDPQKLIAFFNQKNTLSGNWLTNQEIPQSILPLWYAGLIAFNV
jgi:2,3-bisphosphoglycerate-independent phosphoglycerate mutase